MRGGSGGGGMVSLPGSGDVKVPISGLGESNMEWFDCVCASVCGPGLTDAW